MKRAALVLTTLLIFVSDLPAAFASDPSQANQDACAQKLNPDWKGSIDLSFGSSIAVSFDKHNVYNSFVAAIEECKKHTTLSQDHIVLHVHDAKPVVMGSELFISARVDLIINDVRTFVFSFKKFPVLNESLDEALTGLATSINGHNVLLKNPGSIIEEANMVAFNLKKALLLSNDNSTVSTLNSLILQLESRKSLFESKASHGSRIFIELLQAKKYLTSLAQNQMAQLNNDESSHLKFEQSSRIFSASRSKERSKYYWPQSSSYETYNNVTMAWIYDPAFMRSHPWFWGTSDQSLFAPMMMFEVLNDRSRTAAPFLADAAVPYNHRQFIKPVDPLFSGDYSNPFVGSPAERVQEMSSANGYQALRAEAVNSSGVSSSGGWSAFDSSQQAATTGLFGQSFAIGWKPSTDTDSSTPINSTGFDWPASNQTNTGQDTSFGSTTTGFDTTTTTTTTGFDNTTGNGGFD